MIRVIAHRPKKLKRLKKAYTASFFTGLEAVVAISAVALLFLGNETTGFRILVLIMLMSISRRLEWRS